MPSGFCIICIHTVYGTLPVPSKYTQLNSTADFGTCCWYLHRTDSIKKEVTDAANHSLIWKEVFFFPNGLNYLMMNSNAAEKRKNKSWQDNFQLGFNARGSCGFLLLGGLYALAHSLVW